jgi:hypothetical protein
MCLPLNGRTRPPSVAISIAKINHQFERLYYVFIGIIHTAEDGQVRPYNWADTEFCHFEVLLCN